MILYTDAFEVPVGCVLFLEQTEKEADQSDTDPAHLPALNSHMIRQNEHLFRFSGRWCYLDRTVRVRVSQSAPITTHLSAY